MVEWKTSPYDENPPMVEATPTDQGVGDLLHLDDSNVEQIQESNVTRGGSTSTSQDMEDIPTMPTEEEEREQQLTVGAGVASGILGL